MKRMVAILLTFCLLISASGCCCTWDVPDEIVQNLTQQTQPQQSQPLPFSYTLTQADIDTFYALLDESEKLALESTDFDAVDALTDQLDDQYTLIDDQCDIAQLLYYCHMTDQEASDRYLKCVDIIGDAHDAYMQMVRRIYESQAPTKDQLFADWTQQDLQMLMAYTPEVMELQKRNSELLVQYQALEDPTDDAMIPLYIEQVSNNNRMAQIFGYDNYYDYAFQLAYERDYSMEQLQQMRRFVATHLAPIYADAYVAFDSAYVGLDYMDQITLSYFMENNYDECDQPYYQNYLDSLPEEMGNVMSQGLQEGNVYFADSENAFAGAFTTVVGETSFCFFGPGYQDSMTVIHELGHFYGSNYTDLVELPLDLAETQSQGNEWLFMGYLSQHMDPEVFQAQLSYKMLNDLGIIQICVLVDEFEQRIYTEPNLESFTAQDFNRVMEEICAGYGGLEYLSYWVTDVQSYWRMVVMESPVYYISYAVSALAAMNLYTMYQQQPQAAVEAYRSLVEMQEENQGFLQTVELAGLPGPFDESVYVALAKMYEKNS